MQTMAQTSKSRIPVKNIVNLINEAGLTIQDRDNVSEHHKDDKDLEIDIKNHTEVPGISKEINIESLSHISSHQMIENNQQNAIYDQKNGVIVVERMIIPPKRFESYINFSRIGKKLLTLQNKKKITKRKVINNGDMVINNVMSIEPFSKGSDLTKELARFQVKNHKRKAVQTTSMSFGICSKESVSKSTEVDRNFENVEVQVTFDQSAVLIFASEKIKTIFSKLKVIEDDLVSCKMNSRLFAHGDVDLKSGSLQASSELVAYIPKPSTKLEIPSNLENPNDLEFSSKLDQDNIHKVVSKISMENEVISLIPSANDLEILNKQVQDNIQKVAFKNAKDSETETQIEKETVIKNNTEMEKEALPLNYSPNDLEIPSKRIEDIVQKVVSKTIKEAVIENNTEMKNEKIPSSSLANDLEIPNKQIEDNVQKAVSKTTKNSETKTEIKKETVIENNTEIKNEAIPLNSSANDLEIPIKQIEDNVQKVDSKTTKDSETETEIEKETVIKDITVKEKVTIPLNSSTSITKDITLNAAKNFKRRITNERINNIKKMLKDLQSGKSIEKGLTSSNKNKIIVSPIPILSEEFIKQEEKRLGLYVSHSIFNLSMILGRMESITESNVSVTI